MQGNARQAKSLLLAVCDKFTEGFAPFDLKEARAVLDSFPMTSR